MSIGDPIPFPVARLAPESTADATDRSLTEIEVAVELVRTGRARRIRLAGLPFAEDLAAIGASRAGLAGVAFRIEHGPGSLVTVTIGPLTPAGTVAGPSSGQPPPAAGGAAEASGRDGSGRADPGSSSRR
jgi:hypothetical protein